MSREEKQVWDILKKKFIPPKVYELYDKPVDRAFGRMTQDWEEYREDEQFYPEYQEIISNPLGSSPKENKNDQNDAETFSV